MTRSLAVAASLVALAAPAAASAATLTVTPQKPCYVSNETVNFVGSGFSPSSNVNLTRDGTFVGPIPTDGTGQFTGALTLGQDRGSQTRTYTITDAANPSLTASTQIRVSALQVRLRPSTGAVTRRFRISARGFTTGRTLWAHVLHRRSKRHLKLGRLKGACHVIRARRRLLSPNGPFGVYTIQFDTFRKYEPRRTVKFRYTITVVRSGR